MKAVRASVLVLALSFSVFAGEIPNPAPPPDSQKTSQTTQEPTLVYGEIHNPEMTEITLNLLTSVLSLF